MEKEELINKLREFRQNCFDMKQRVKDLSDHAEDGTVKGHNSRELSLAFTAFEKAQMWAGNSIGYLPDSPEYPYPESIDPSTGDDIAPLHDIEEEHGGKMARLSYIQLIKGIRRDAKEILDNFYTRENLLQIQNIELSDLDTSEADMLKMAFNTIFVNCREGINWLGAELGRIREEQNEE